MRLFLIGVFVFFFVAMPMYLLDNVLMPQLNGLEQRYNDAGDIAGHIANADSLQQ